MKLRNKKTGEHGDYKVISAGYLIRVKDCNSDETWQYDCLAGFIDKWEDYKPTEPLIKDPKIRKAVIAWAEANGIKDVVCYATEYGFKFAGNPISLEIRFNQPLEIDTDGIYTITELCGDEECES